MVLNLLGEGKMTAAEVAQVLGISQRHVRRIKAAYGEDGAAALAHGNRGRRPPNALDPSLCAQIVEMARAAYVGCNYQHLCDLLAERPEPIAVSHSSVRRILMTAGLSSSRQRRSPKHRSRRERRPQAGMLLQIDGSWRDWLEGRGPQLTLIAGIDDVTNDVPYALFRRQEDAQGYFLLVRQIVTAKGIPLAVYSDRHGIFRRDRKGPETLEEQLAGRREPTQLGRLMQELLIETIFANSPQAKGRIERLFGTFQDRLLVELRMAGASCLEEANEVLWPFLPRYNLHFARPPAQADSAYRPVPMALDLEKVFCFKYWRTVGNDNVVKLEDRSIQIPAGVDRVSYAKAHVEVHEHLDGSLAVYYNGKQIARDEARVGPEAGADLRVRRRHRADYVPPKPAWHRG